MSLLPLTCARAVATFRIVCLCVCVCVCAVVCVVVRVCVCALYATVPDSTTHAHTHASDPRLTHRACPCHNHPRPLAQPDNKIGDDGAAHLGRALQVNKTLTTLDLTGD